MPPFVLPLSFLMLSSSLSLAADNCETLRLQIEANIASKGIGSFSVSTVDAAADVPGQVVGTCAQGAKKIVYARGSAPAASPALRTPSATTAPATTSTATARPAATRPAAKRPTPDDNILTECRDGTASMGGRCPP